MAVDLQSLPRCSDISKAVLVTHRGCLDGAGCVIVFLAAGGLRENVRYIAAGMVERFIKKDLPDLGDRFVIFADVAFNTMKYVDVLEKRGNVVIIDHHGTSSHMKERSWCYIDTDGPSGSACGCVLLQQYLPPAELPTTSWTEYDLKKFCNVIDDQDRWQHRFDESSLLAMLMTFYGQDYFIDRFYLPRIGLFNKFDHEVLNILENRRDEASKNALSHIIVERISSGLLGRGDVTIGYTFSSDPNISHILHYILECRKDIDVVCQISVDRGVVSLRSRDGGPDVALIAKAHKGGGHIHAAGHAISKNLLDELVKGLHQ